MGYVVNPLHEELGLRAIGNEGPLISCCKECGPDGTESPDHRANLIMDNAMFEVLDQIKEADKYVFECPYCNEPLLEITASEGQ